MHFSIKVMKRNSIYETPYCIQKWLKPPGQNFSIRFTKSPFCGCRSQPHLFSSSSWRKRRILPPCRSPKVARSEKCLKNFWHLKPIWVNLSNLMLNVLKESLFCCLLLLSRVSKADRGDQIFLHSLPHPNDVPRSFGSANTSRIFSSLSLRFRKRLPNFKRSSKMFVFAGGVGIWKENKATEFCPKWLI